MEVKGQLHAPASLIPGKYPSTHLVGGWMGPIAGLDFLEKRKITFSYRKSNPGSSSP